MEESDHPEDDAHQRPDDGTEDAPAVRVDFLEAVSDRDQPLALDGAQVRPVRVAAVIADRARGLHPGPAFGQQRLGPHGGKVFATPGAVAGQNHLHEVLALDRRPQEGPLHDLRFVDA